jgi:hypothetical protein
MWQDHITHMDRAMNQSDLDMVMDFFNIVRTPLAPGRGPAVLPALKKTGADSDVCAACLWL